MSIASGTERADDGRFGSVSDTPGSTRPNFDPYLNVRHTYSTGWVGQSEIE